MSTMRSFFRRLDVERVRYLLISGQASVLYGGAEFSEDVDLWLDPAVANVAAFLDSLRAVRGTVYKLTPPLSHRHLRRGHGFHFLVPAHRGAFAYLDVMGRPPRVGSFASALRRATLIDSDWGTLPVVSIPDLVELKKTRRLADYDVITSLVRIRVRQQERVRRSLLRWALGNAFRVEEILWLLGLRGDSTELAREVGRPSVVALAKTPGRSGDADSYALAQPLIATEIAALQARDVAYWSPIIDELRVLHRAGRLLPLGSRP